MNTHRPDPLRCAVLVLLSLCCAALLIELNASTPWPPPDAFVEWWERHGTAAASITLFRIVGIALAGWGIFVGTTGLLATLRPSGLLQGVWRRVTPSSFREILAASVVAAALAAPASAAPQSVDARVVLEDLGPQVEPSRFTPLLSDLGPLEVDPPIAGPSRQFAQATAGSPDPDTTAPDPDTTAPRLVESSTASDQPAAYSASSEQHWTVGEGDHLWGIAVETLRVQGYDAEPAEVLSYWRLLIETNREILNGNPDLIHPGTVLALPPVSPT